MPAYTFGGYIYFMNITDHPEIHHRVYILNQRHDMYITSPLKVFEEIYLISKTIC